jgi:hypothetical protein|tara:strand:- start:250 stop:891 length:642 start_codon:yes stop_codon:yes gene_type:complete
MSQTEVQLIKADAVQTADIANSAVTDAKISALTSSKLTGALPAISGAALTGITAGITMADQWRISNDRNLSGSSEILDANWERNDGGYFSQIGTGMTQSSGVYTFPSTGIYLVEYNLTMYSLSLTQRYSGAVIQVTTNNSSYAAQATSYFNAGVSHGSGCYMNGECKIIIDVTDTSTHKVRFVAQSATPANAYVAGNSNEQITGVTFIRLGDT